jgi:hypothetical protein
LSILDRFRKLPEWQNPDPSVRAAAVRRLAPSEHRDLLVEVARADADPQVRRAAVRKVGEPGVVVELARTDEDPGVREAALDTLLDMGLGSDAAVAAQAAAALDHPRHLAALARDAALAPVRMDAVRRLGNDRALTALARGAEDADVRREAVARVVDEAAVLEIALKSEHKDAAVAAVERLVGRESLESAAASARNKAAARRARALADERWPRNAEAPPPPAPAPAAAVDDHDAERYDALLARQTEEAAQQAARVASRVALCDAVEAMGADEDRLDELVRAWAALPALEGADADVLQRRFEAAGDAWRKRRETWEGAQARRARMDAVCADLEAIAEITDVAEAERRHAEVRKAWKGLQSMEGVDADLQERYARAVARLEARQADARRDAARSEEAARARLEALCVQAERLAVEASPSLKESERALREARAALDAPAPPGTPKRDRDALMSRLRAARASLYTRVQDLRETEDWKRWANVGVQEDLCKEAEALVLENDLPKAARRLRDLDERWKQASQVPKAQAEPLWQRFRTARSLVRARCAVHFAEVRAARAENVKKKEALIAEAEALAGSTDWARTAERLRAMQGEWRATGPVTRAKSEELWARFRAAGGRFFARQKEDRTRRRAERAKNLERKQALCAEAEALAESSEWDRALAEIKRLQSEWRATGPVAKDKAEALSLRFRQAGDRFFERYKNRDALEATARAAEREAMCAALEALAAPGSEAPENIAERVRAAQAAWKAAPALSGPQAGVFQARHAAAVEAVIEAWPDAFKGTDLDTAANRARLEALCATVETMARDDAKPAAAAAASPAAVLAAQWREALAANTMGARVDESARKRERKDKVDAARAAWSRVGPVGASDRERLNARFREACRRALGDG